MNWRPTIDEAVAIIAVACVIAAYYFAGV